MWRRQPLASRPTAHLVLVLLLTAVACYSALLLSTDSRPGDPEQGDRGNAHKFPWLGQALLKQQQQQQQQQQLLPWFQGSPSAAWTSPAVGNPDLYQPFVPKQPVPDNENQQTSPGPGSGSAASEGTAGGAPLPKVAMPDGVMHELPILQPKTQRAQNSTQASAGYTQHVQTTSAPLKNAAGISSANASNYANGAVQPGGSTAAAHTAAGVAAQSEATVPASATKAQVQPSPAKPLNGKCSSGLIIRQKTTLGGPTCPFNYPKITIEDVESGISKPYSFGGIDRLGCEACSQRGLWPRFCLWRRTGIKFWDDLNCNTREAFGRESVLKSVNFSMHLTLNWPTSSGLTGLLTGQGNTAGRASSSARLASAALTLAPGPVEMTPCNVWRLIRGRTLWIIGDSQMKSVFLALKCFMLEFWTDLRQYRPSWNATVNEYLQNQLPNDAEAQCIHMADSTRICQLVVVSAGIMVDYPAPGDTRWGEPVLRLLQRQLASPDDIFALSFGLWYKPWVPGGKEMYRADLESLGRYYQATAATFPHVFFLETVKLHYPSPAGEQDMVVKKRLKQCAPTANVEFNPADSSLISAMSGTSGVSAAALENAKAAMRYKPARGRRRRRKRRRLAGVAHEQQLQAARQRGTVGIPISAASPTTEITVMPSVGTAYVLSGASSNSSNLAIAGSTAAKSQVAAQALPMSNKPPISQVPAVQATLLFPGPVLVKPSNTTTNSSSSSGSGSPGPAPSQAEVKSVQPVASDPPKLTAEGAVAVVLLGGWRNNIAKNVLRDKWQLPWVPIYNTTVPTYWGHRNQPEVPDCIHYCNPGVPQNIIAQLMLAIAVRVSPLEGQQVADKRCLWGSEVVVEDGEDSFRD